MTHRSSSVSALILLLFSPIVAEFLLGDFSVRQAWLLALLVPQYGGGALLIRELARRTGGGWPNIVLLALAYGVIEEAFTTQSLFNPNYLGLHLLQYGFLPDVGMSPVWSVFVLSIHVVWSMCAPIAIAEGLAGSQSRTPWLKAPWLAGVFTLFLVGCVLAGALTAETFPYVASPWQYAVTGAVVVALVVVGLQWRPAGARPVDTGAPPLVVVAAGSALMGLAFFQIHHAKFEGGLGPWAVALSLLALGGAAVAILCCLGRSRRWGAAHAASAATGVIAVYGWTGLHQFWTEGKTNTGIAVNTFDIAGQITLALAVLALCVAAVLRSREVAPNIEPRNGRWSPHDDHTPRGR